MSVAEKLAALAGVNFTMVTQELPAARVLPQVVEKIEKSAGLVPPMLRTMLSGPVPILFNCRLRLLSDPPTITGPKL